MLDIVGIGGGGGGFCFQIRQGLAGAVEGREGERGLAQQGVMAGEGIEQAAMGCDVEQPAIVGLAVDLQQCRADIAQQTDADGFVVDKGAGAAVLRQCPAQHDLGLGRDRLLGEQREGGIGAGGLEQRGGRALGRAGTDRGAAAATSAGGESQGIEQDRLAGTRLAGEHVEGPARIPAPPFRSIRCPAR